MSLGDQTACVADVERNAQVLRKMVQRSQGQNAKCGLCTRKQRRHCVQCSIAAAGHDQRRISTHGALGQVPYFRAVVCLHQLHVHTRRAERFV